MIGRFKDAIRCYRKSIELNATPEAHTCLGFVLSCLGRFEDAIGECLSAISLDPEYGNPANDIGAYLIELGRHEEAVPWLKRACWARRYECKEYAHFNLGRVYESKGLWCEALGEYRDALAVHPNYHAALDAYGRLMCQMN
jgi:tetratricopeptide (TPR) repeat protein